jgi:hypothetical protein
MCQYGKCWSTTLTNCLMPRSNVHVTVDTAINTEFRDRGRIIKFVWVSHSLRQSRRWIAACAFCPLEPCVIETDSGMVDETLFCMATEAKDWVEDWFECQ